MAVNDKTIYFVSGLPRSGSTLVMNILGQNPNHYVTPTSGIVDMLVQTRNQWLNNDAFRSYKSEYNETLKLNVMRNMLYGYFEHTDCKICFDKSRFWPEYLEMASALLGGNDRVKVLITVRDLRDVVASFEQLFRRTAALGQIPQDANNPMKFKTALGRVETFIDNGQPVGRAYSAIHDAVVRGWRKNMMFIDYEQLTKNPKTVFQNVYQFLEQDYFEHNFQQIKQITYEDDSAYGFKDLHIIRPTIKPQASYWKTMFDDALFNTQVWKNIENLSHFWRKY